MKKLFDADREAGKFKYALIDAVDTQIDEEFFESKDEAIKEADYRWKLLTSREKKVRTIFEVMYGRVDDDNCFDFECADSIKDYLKQKLGVNTYNGDCTVFFEDAMHRIEYNADALDEYSPNPAYSAADNYESREEAEEQYRRYITAEIENEFPMAVNIEDIVATIMIHASATIAAMWAEEEK